MTATSICFIEKSNTVVFDEAHVSYVEPISKRSRLAKQAMLFVELKAHFAG